MYSRVVFFILIINGLSCVAPNKTFEKIPPGIWRGTLLLDRAPSQKYGDDRDIVKKFDTNAELPFNFEVVYDNDTIFHIVLHNADERIKITDIKFGRDKSTAKDTVIIAFPIYDTQIKAIYEDGVMEGDWIVNYKENYKIPFKAVHGVADRFSNVGNEAPIQIEGKWNVKFEIGTEDEYKAVGIFKQNKEIITGTFLTETGDYRYLEGKVVKNKLYLSVFDGAHAFLFLGKMMEDSILTGTFRSGSQYVTNWEAKKSNKSELATPYELTMPVGKGKLDFQFENEIGKLVSINDEQYHGKVKVVQIMGTWCPNCMDETKFLKDYFQKHPDNEVAIISIGFERYKDTLKSKQALARFKDRMDITHEVLLGGYYEKQSAAEKIPQINHIISYPTMIITNTNNEIVSIHTGFNGPATPEYKNFEKEFEAIITKAKNKKLEGLSTK